jgi:hypothetical protein
VLFIAAHRDSLYSSWGVTNDPRHAQDDMKNATLKSLLIATAGIACGVASGAELMAGSSRLCAVAAQNRSKLPMSTDGVDDLVERAMTRAGFNVVNLAFEPPADVEYAARLSGCSHILYTDLVHAKESAGSPACRAFRRFTGTDNTMTANAEIEFRLFRIDEVLPLVSTSVKGKATARRLSPWVSSRVLDIYEVSAEPSPTNEPLRFAALSDAFTSQARVLRQAMSAAPQQR